MRVASITKDTPGYYISIYEDGACIDGFSVDKITLELEEE